MRAPRVPGNLLAALLLSVSVILAFSPALRNGFVYDDVQYVTENPHVRDGLTIAGVRWAFTTGYAANWHPLTWLTHMLDAELFGLRPAGHHATNLVLHLAATILLFLLVYRLTNARGRSVIVAALFGVHPLHVESVAWIAERKDVLSAVFWMLATLAYVRYARSAARSSYWTAVALLALGLSAKPMLVTLPFTLLLLDYWPLGRWTGNTASEPGRWWPLLREKVPLFVLAAASSIVTLLVQRSGSAVVAWHELPLAARAQNAVVSYVLYLGKTIWPRRLAVFYPHPEGSLSGLAIVGASLALVAVTLLAIVERRRRPYLLVGWLWYLGTLVPVIGLVQVGSQAAADRYTYIPLIGIFVVLAWGVPDVLASLRSALPRRLLERTVPGRDAPGIAWAWGAVLLALIFTTRAQVRPWRDSVSLFQHALASTDASANVHTLLGDALDDAGRGAEAADHYREALRLDPSFAPAHANLGVVLDQEGRRAEAIAEYREAVRLDPSRVEVHDNLGRALAAEGQLQEAARHFSDALRLTPDDARVNANLGEVLYGLGRIEEAIAHYTHALRIQPDYPEALNNLGIALAAGGRLDEALESFARALRLRPNYALAHVNRAAALYSKARYREAWEEIRLARQDGTEPPVRLTQLLSARWPEPR